MSTVAEKVITYLLVDDTTEHAANVESCLRELVGPPRIRRVTSGAECLAYLAGDGDYIDRSIYPEPDVVLLDMRISGDIDGLQILEAIHADPKRRSLPVVVLSTSEGNGEAICARDLGAIGYIIRSGPRTKLRQELAELHKSLLTEAPPIDSDVKFAVQKRPAEESHHRPANETEMLDELMSMELPEAYRLLVNVYRHDRWEALQLLLSLNQVVPGRFSRLAVSFCEKDGQLLAGGADVDWEFLQQIIMNKLPSCTSRDEFAAIVSGISSILDANEEFDHHAPPWYMWQGFHRAAARSRQRSRDSKQEARPPREQIVLQPVGETRWRRTAIICFVLWIGTVAAYVVEKFLTM